MDKKFREEYILDALENISMSGDAYTTEELLFQECRRDRPKLALADFRRDESRLFQIGRLVREGRRVYNHRTLEYENASASYLASILRNNDLDQPVLPATITSGGVTLTTEQHEAVAMALTHRLSIVLGGAGSGKTTLIEAIVRYRPKHPCGWVICAPTGKAACNITRRTGLQARTVHAALGRGTDTGFLSPVAWPHTSLVVVDEASMMTIEMLAGILSVASAQCRIVLVGDPNQLLSVGSGNVIPDLLRLGVPYKKLEACHRQSDEVTALAYNVRNYSECRTLTDLHFDDSFRFINNTDDKMICKSICYIGSELYQNGFDVQVLSPYNKKGTLAVTALNKILQGLINPATEDNSCPDVPFRSMDRIMVLENDWEQHVCNGDVGLCKHMYIETEKRFYTGIWCEDERGAIWTTETVGGQLSLAYAITIHKSQGSEYETVVLPISKCFSNMLSRNLLYTAISRAKKNVILIGDPDALEMALQKEPTTRRSMLVTKTRMLIQHIA